MSERDIFLIVMGLITATTLVVFIVQFARSRGSKRDGGAWWEGPWDDDERR